MTRQTIAVDIDDVLAAHAEAFVDHSNANYGTNITIEEYIEEWSKLWGVGHDEVERRATEFHHPDIVGNFGAFEAALPVLNSLKENRNLVIVTARRKKLLDTTRNWLSHHFDGVFSEIHFVPIWEPNNTVTKADICTSIGPQYLIDDLVRHCNLAAEVGIRPLLFGNYSWNQGESQQDVTRVKNWQEVLEYFDDKSR